LNNYEIIYIDSLNKKTDLPFNNLATILNVNGEPIHGAAVILKNFIDTITTTRYFEDMTTSELHKILHFRAYVQVVVWENDNDIWREEEFYGDIDTYAKRFFEEEKYSSMEIAFLKHNLNILYLKSEYGKENACGSLLSCKVEKIIIFTMLTSSIRGNITKQEVEKIIELSTILPPPFKPDNKWFDDEKDEHNRVLIKNKYRILDNVYLENTKK
jgi:hypothetical protein